MEENKTPSVQTVLSISNTDIVTMLMVQQKKLLKEKLPTLRATLKEIEDSYQLRVEEILSERIRDNVNIIPLREAIYTINRIYNPKIEFRVDFNDSITDFARRIIQGTFNSGYNHTYVKPEITIDTLPGLSIYVGALGLDDDEVSALEDDFHFVNDENEYEIPHKWKDTIAIRGEDKELWKETADQIDKIQLLLRDDSKMKEEIIAKMTAKAIGANIELQAIVGDILLLE